MHLSGDRLFWVVTGTAGIGVLLILVCWAIPAHVAAGRAAYEWEEAVSELERLETLTGEIPSRGSLEKYSKFHAWVRQEQLGEIQAFFSDRAKILSVPLTGEGTVTPSEFKGTYTEAHYRAIGRLENESGRMRVDPGVKPFPTYSWMTTPEFPNPQDYPTILQRYWVHYYLYEMLLDAKVRVVRRMEIKGEAGPVYVDQTFDGIPIEAELMLHPRNVNKLIRDLMKVSRTASVRPIVELRRLQIESEASGEKPGSLCRVQIEGYVLLLREKGAKK